MTTPGEGAPDGAYVVGTPGDYGKSESQITSQWTNRVGGGFVGAQVSFFDVFLGGFTSLLEAIFSTVDNSYVEQLPIIQEQQNYIEELQEAVEKQILQGQSVYYDSNNTHHISDGVTSIDFIILGSGGGGGGGRTSGLFVGGAAGGGGGGGGEVHLNVPRSLLGDVVEIKVGAGGSGGGFKTPGTGGTPSEISVTDGSISAGGGFGGMADNQTPTPARGGVGMIAGGDGGAISFTGGAENPTYTPSRPGDSVSQYDLHGGGGGGGSGKFGSTRVQTGGSGGISSGGVPTEDGENATGLAATGGGGGGGGTENSSGGSGGFPSGGGGGGSGGNNGHGGNGAAGRVYVIERMA